MLRNAPPEHTPQIVPEKTIRPFTVLRCARSDLRILIFDWTFASLHVKSVLLCVVLQKIE